MNISKGASEMKVENVGEFFTQLKEDTELEKKYIQLMKTNNEMIVSRMVEFAQENGFDFDEKDLQTFTEEKLNEMGWDEQLSEDELEQTAGGFARWRGFEIGQGFSYHRCY